MKPALALLFAAGLAWSAAAAAQSLDLSRGGPISISAEEGIEWRQDLRVVVARGPARAERGGVTIDAARLIARYRGGPEPAAALPFGQPGPAGAGEASAGATGGRSEIWRLEAEGGVRIRTASETATAERAVYDMDQAVLVLSGGRELGLSTPQAVIRASESLEYWTRRRLAVARGDATVTTPDGRSLRADVLAAYLPPEGAAPPPPPAPGRPAPPGQGQLDRVELFGRVEIRTAEEVLRADRGVYSAATGIARLSGNVRITRGPHQVNGEEAVVDLNTGISRLLGAPGGGRVQGLIAPTEGGRR
ncbi:MAG: hypothetical protein N2588_04175 [Rhodovarius sp.]|nr:hypothetical protein [Rhodovarius sp.]